MTLGELQTQIDDLITANPAAADATVGIGVLGTDFVKKAENWDGAVYAANQIGTTIMYKKVPAGIETVVFFQ